MSSKMSPLILELPQVAKALRLVLELHRATVGVQPLGDETPWCEECVKGWDGEDFPLIAYPCATTRLITDTMKGYF